MYFNQHLARYRLLASDLEEMLYASTSLAGKVSGITFFLYNFEDAA